MARYYSAGSFFRQVNKHLLACYSESRGLGNELDFAAWTPPQNTKRGEVNGVFKKPPSSRWRLWAGHARPRRCGKPSPKLVASRSATPGFSTPPAGSTGLFTLRARNSPPSLGPGNAPSRSSGYVGVRSGPSGHGLPRPGSGPHAPGLPRSPPGDDPSPLPLPGFTVRGADFLAGSTAFPQGSMWREQPYVQIHWCFILSI